MNFNANAGVRAPSSGARKPKRVSDVNAMGAPAAPMAPMPQYTPNPYDQNQSMPYMVGGDQYYGQPQQPPQNYAQQYPAYGNTSPTPQHPQQQAVPPGTNQFSQFPTMLQQPIVQDMAFQYGQKLADQGKELVNSHFEKYVPVTKLKYYFAVDNKYVINKLRLLFFPFTHKDWSLKYDHDNPVQPRYDINAPDLYIPTMAYITYVVLAGLVLGMQNRFSPEQLGIQASSALAYSIFELVIYTIMLYVLNISTSLKTFDLVALSGYKYAIMMSILISSILMQRTGYWIMLIYCSFSLSVFLLRTLRAKVLTQPVQVQNPPSYDPYGQQNNFEHTLGRKRKLYFLFLLTGLQPVLCFWLTMHLIPSSAAE